MRTEPTFLVINLQTIKIYQIASTCKERNQLNEENLRILQLSYRGASGCGTAPHIKAAALCTKQIGIVLISDRAERRVTIKLHLIYVICNCAVWSSIKY
jgi:hypothetical protein